MYTGMTDFKDFLDSATAQQPLSHCSAIAQLSFKTIASQLLLRGGFIGKYQVKAHVRD
jgi:hypothetical protein